MAKRGRKPKNPQLKILEGVRADRRVGEIPRSVDAKITCPAYLDDSARAEWDRITPQLEALGILDACDEAAIAIYCDAHSRWLEARKTIAEHGVVTETALGGLKSNPAVSACREAAQQMLAILEQFGCTPLARGRLTVKIEKEIDEFDEFLKKRKA